MNTSCCLIDAVSFFGERVSRILCSNRLSLIVMITRVFSKMRSSSRVTNAFLLTGLFLAALLPRLTAIGRYITPDELAWVFRSIQFRQALLAGRWADTIVSGHPGVLTTWLGMIGISLQLLIRPADQAIYDWVTHVVWFTPDNMTLFSQLARFLMAGRVVTAVFNTLGIVVIYVLARRLWDDWVAAAAVLLLAFDPFTVGLSGLLHVDSLMTTCAAIALLSLFLIAAPNQKQTPRACRWLAALSGGMAAWAILTKVPAILLLPVTALGLLGGLLWERDKPFYDRFRQTAVTSLIWGGSFAFTALLSLPALWAAPAHVVQWVTSNTNRHIETTLRPIFFWGTPTYEPGPFFYPVVLAFRLSPLVFIGLTLAIFFFSRTPARRTSRFFAAGMLLLWSALFIIGLSPARKKFDRYALAVVPELALLAALGWARLAARRPRLRPYLLPTGAVLLLILLLTSLPFPLAAYNPLLGGSQTAQDILPIGWGEAISVAGDWLAAQPDVTEKTAVAGIAPAFAPFFPGQTLLFNDANLPQADYIIHTLGGRQMNPDGFERAMRDFTLLHTIRYNGLDQAWIFAQSQPQKPNATLTRLSEPISFDNRVQLRATQAVVAEEKLHFYARWHLLPGGENGRYTLTFTLRDENGRAWAGTETELVNAVYFYPAHWLPGETPELRYSLDLPPGLPPDSYELDLTLFDSASGDQLPVLGVDGRFRGVVYTQADVVVTAPVPGETAVPILSDAAWLDGRLVLLGHEPLPVTMESGQTAVLDLYWQANAALPDGLQIVLTLGETGPLQFPLSRYDTAFWKPGEQIHEKYDLVVSPDLAAGVYPLNLQLAGADGTLLGETAVSLGQIEITTSDRLFTLPDDMPIALDYSFATGIELRGMNWQTAAAPGDDVRLTLYWQTASQPTALLNAFVHLVSPDGVVVAQDDRWPGGLPSVAWVSGQVIIDEYAIPLPADTPPGQYQVAVGLYTPEDGLRLPVTDAAGTAVPDNRILLPVTLIVDAADE